VSNARLTKGAFLTILDEPADEADNYPALMSEATLADWKRTEKNDAWSHLQQER
jgi:hypothetical protein